MFTAYGYRKKNIADSWEIFSVKGMLVSIPSVEEFMRLNHYNYYLFTIVENKA